MEQFKRETNVNFMQLWKLQVAYNKKEIASMGPQSIKQQEDQLNAAKEEEIIQDKIDQNSKKLELSTKALLPRLTKLVAFMDKN